MDNSKLNILILGTGTTSINAERGSPGFLLRIGELNILLDSGNGTLYRMALANISIYEINMVCYTHLHPDHVSDLLPLLHSIKWDPNRPSNTTRIQLLGPTSVIDYYDSLVELWGQSISSDNERLIVQPTVMGNTNKIFNDINVHTKHVEHTEDSIAYRFEFNGISLAYSGDTDICESIKALSKNCDVLIIDCSFPSKRKVKGHLTPVEIEQIVNEAKPCNVILTHIYPGWTKDEWNEVVDLAQSERYIIGQDFMSAQISKCSEPKIEIISPNFSKVSTRM